METSRFRPEPSGITPQPSPEQAAAVIAALEQFLRDTAAPPMAAAEPPPSPWKRAALVEGVTQQPDASGLWR